ncbi:Ran-specific GTPase-activating protein 1 [Dictyocoela roeselum]|nr:Ran-specific GTPase-activating protein 1 [Dictyocoela roeselum]
MTTEQERNSINIHKAQNEELDVGNKELLSRNKEDDKSEDKLKIEKKENKTNMIKNEEEDKTKVIKNEKEDKTKVIKNEEDKPELVKKEEIKEEVENDDKNNNVSKQSTEEEGKSLFTASCKLFRYDSAKEEIKGRGSGQVHILHVPESNLYKILMVREFLKRLGCNHYINCPLEVHPKYDHTYMWSTSSDKIDDIGGSEEQTFIIKFKNREDAEGFEKAYAEAREANVKELSKRK